MPTADKIEWPQGNPLFEVNLRAISESLAGNGIANAGDLEVTATANAMEIEVGTGTAYYVNTEYTLGTAQQFTISSADASDDRWDTVYFDTATTSAGVRTGTPATSPEPPDIQGDEILLSVVYVPAGATDIPNSQILNWRGRVSNEGDEVRYKDTSGFYSATTVSGALDNAVDLFVTEAGDNLDGPLDLTNFSGQSPFDLGTNPGAFGAIVDAVIDSNSTAGTAHSFYYALDGNNLLEVYAESDGAGGVQNLRVDLPQLVRVGDDIETIGGTTIWDSANGWIPASVVQEISLESGTDLDIGTSDLTAESGAVTVFNNTTNQVPRTQIDDEKITSSVITSNTTTSGEEVVLVDTSSGGVTITLASADANSGNSLLIIDVNGDADVNPINVDTESGETINNSSSYTMDTAYGSLLVTSDSTNWFTTGGSGLGFGIDIEDNGSTVNSNAEGIDAGSGLTATDNGDGTVTIDSDAGGVNVLTTGTFTHTGGSATSETVTGVTTDQTANLYVEVGVSADPSFSADYAWDWTDYETWDDLAGEKDVTIDATWNTDPGSGNDVVLDYRIYTLDVSVTKSRVQDLVDSPNGHIPVVLLEDTESAEITVPVPDNETLKVFRWGGYKISDGTAPTGLDVELLDGSDTVQATENTVNTENITTPVASHGNTSGSLSIFKLRIANDTGTNYTTDGVGAMFAYVVE